jgi:hypothetical protein
MRVIERGSLIPLLFAFPISLSVYLFSGWREVQKSIREKKSREE